MRGNTNLARLMLAFDLQGRELAAWLNVDVSLVSKWRTGKRKLNKKSLYLKEIVRYFISQDKNGQFARILKVLSDECMIEPGTGSQELSVILGRWLSTYEIGGEESALNNFVEANKLKENKYYVLKGEEGAKKTKMVCLDVAIQEGADTEMMIFTQEPPLNLEIDGDYHGRWVENCLEFLKLGGKLKIIIPVMMEYRALAGILLYWLPMYLQGNTEVYFYMQGVEDTVKKQLCYVRNQCAVYRGIYENSLEGDSCTYLFTDRGILEEVNRYLDSIAGKCVPAFNGFNTGSSRMLRELFKMSVKLLQGTYNIGMFLSCFLMEPLKFEIILKQNGLPDEERKECCAIQKMMYKVVVNRLDCRFFRTICWKEWLEEVIKKTDFEFESASILCDRKIMIHGAQFRDYIEDIIKLMEKYHNFDLVLTEKVLHKNHPYFIKDGYYLMLMWDSFLWAFKRNSEEGCIADGKIIMTQNVSVVNSCYYFFDKEWMFLPNSGLDREMTIGKLKTYIMRYRDI